MELPKGHGRWVACKTNKKTSIDLDIFPCKEAYFFVCLFHFPWTLCREHSLSLSPSLFFSLVLCVCLCFPLLLIQARPKPSPASPSLAQKPLGSWVIVTQWFLLAGIASSGTSWNSVCLLIQCFMPLPLPIPGRVYGLLKHTSQNMVVWVKNEAKEGSPTARS